MIDQFPQSARLFEKETKFSPVRNHLDEDQNKFQGKSRGILSLTRGCFVHFNIFTSRSFFLLFFFFFPALCILPS